MKTIFSIGKRLLLASMALFGMGVAQAQDMDEADKTLSPYFW